MANSRIFTRVYSPRSAGELVSGKGQEASFPYTPLLGTTLEEDFRNHAKIWNRNPTALVSFSDRIVDTVQRAFKTHYAFEKGHEKHVSKKDITIAFIAVPPDTRRIYHSAKELAEACKQHLGKNYDLLDPRIYSHEFVFEWAIPENYPVHKVSLQTLVDRGLRQEDFYKSDTQEVQDHIATELQKHGLVEMGLALGFFAQMFGAGAPLDWIAHQLYYDCIEREIVPDYVDDGINVALYDWWLLDADFLLTYEGFKTAYPGIVAEMLNWDLIEFWEFWHFHPNGKPKKLSAKEKSSYDREKYELLAVYEDVKARAIEEEAVRIGL